MSSGLSEQARTPSFALITAVTVSGILANTVLTPNIPDVLADLGQPDSRAGLLVAAAPMPGIVVAPIIGVLADRYGRRRVLVPCLVIFGLAALASAAAPTFTLLIVARLVQGLGGAGLINLSVVLIGDHWSGLERTRLIGRNSAALTVALAVFPSVGGIVGDAANWRWALALGGLTIPLGALVWIRLPADRPGPERGVLDQLRGAGVVLRQPAVLTVLVAGVLLFTVIFGVFLTALPVHLEDEFGLSAGPRGLILSSFAIGATVAAMNLGRLRSRFSTRTVLVGSCTLIAVTAAALGLAPTVVLVVVASIAYGLGDGSAIPTMQDLMTGAAPDDQRGSVMAAWTMGVRVGQTIGPVSASALFGVTSTSTTMLIGAALFAAVALAMLTAPLPTGDAERSPA